MGTSGDYFAVRRAFARALQGGARRLSLSHCEWDISCGCSAPVHRDLHAHPPSEDGIARIDRSTRTPFRVELWTKCGKCDVCLRHRQRLWTNRAMSECRQSIRTWFGTLTLRPEAHYQTYMEACKRYRPSGDLDAADYRKQFTARCAVISNEITRYMKRVRKTSNARLRILFVAEHHKSGLPHYHCLIHEHDLRGVDQCVLREQWKLGFTNWKLITDHKQATYVCKYLSKSGASRIRASIGYGSTSLDIARAFTERSCVQTNDHPNLLSSIPMETKRSDGEENMGCTVQTETSICEVSGPSWH